MYIEFFGLKESPFQLTPDSSFLYLSRAHARAKAYMDYAVLNQDSFVAITGEIGAGKTTLIEKLLSELDQSVVIARIFQTQLNEVEFLQAVLAEFGFEAFNASKVELLHILSRFLKEMHAQGKKVVLIVDEAQNLDRRVLEEIRLLSGIETQKRKILNVILVGQPELSRLLDAPGMEQLVQRIRLRFHIKALSEQETGEYIEHRLLVAGASNRGLFPAEVIPLIYAFTGGIPRLINVLCDTALTVAFADGTTTMSPQVIHDTIEELQWRPYDERHRRTHVLSPSERDGEGREAQRNGPTNEAHTGSSTSREQRIGELFGHIDVTKGYDPDMARSIGNIEEALKEFTELLKERIAERNQK